MAQFISSWGSAVPGRPLLVSEYGAGAVPGMHRLPAVLFSEEMQAAILTADHRAFDKFRARPPGANAGNNTLRPMVGEHVHAFHDFAQAGSSDSGKGPSARTMENDIGGLNYKGLLSLAREPKAAAAVMRARYEMLAEEWGA